MKNKFMLFIGTILTLFLFTGCEEANVTYDATYSSEALIVLIATVVAFIIVAYLTMTIAGFKKELRYINNEIARNTGKDKEYWIKRKRRLFLSLIPFVRY